jgi:acyl-CoA synthetase (NDP forming)
MNAASIIRAARESRRGSLDEWNGKKVLADFGIVVPRSAVVTAPDQVAKAVVGLEPPFAVKVMSAEILHKSDAGGVALRLANSDAVREAISTISERPLIHEARVDGYLIEEMSAGGTELVIGAVRDPQFGLMLMVGLGGIFVEVLQDVAFRICPISCSEGFAMLDELRGAQILDGLRGQESVNKEAIVDILFKVGGPNGLLMTLGDDIAELDLNPVIAIGDGAIAVDARFILAETAEQGGDFASKPYDELSVIDRFTPLFSPKSIAVLGASTTSTTIANNFIRRLKDFGYPGTIYPIHPKATEVEGLRCYPSIAKAPEPIDYAYVAIGAQRIPDVLAGANGNLKFAQVISSGFGEVSEGLDLQRDLVTKAHAGGCRVLGPNCLGFYSPRGGVTFPVDAPKEIGTIGVVSQSGGLGTDIIKRGQWRGIRFSGLVTVGNSADLGPVDLLEFYFEDPQTRVVGLYLEDIKQGRRFFNLLRSDKATKPVVILRGGKSSQGRAAALSHTGALAGDERAWEALSRQTGCVLVATVDEFIDALLAFQFLDVRASKPTKCVVLFGNGGGTGVLATDFFAGLGLDVSPFDDVTRLKLEAMNLPPGTSVVNPIDAPVATLQEEEGRIANRILDTIYTSAAPEAVVMHLNLAAFVGRGDIDPIDNLIQAAVQVQDSFPGQAHFMMVLRVDGSPELDTKMRQYRESALSAGIPVYDELAPAARALKAVSWVEQCFAVR